MSRINEWKLAQKIQASGRRGMITGLLIAAFVILVVVGAIIKVRWLKKHFGCFHCEADDFVDDFIDADDLDDDGCCYTSDKDFA